MMERDHITLWCILRDMGIDCIAFSVFSMLSSCPATYNIPDSCTWLIEDTENLQSTNSSGFREGSGGVDSFHGQI